jgi:hypothetical protein
MLTKKRMAAVMIGALTALTLSVSSAGVAQAQITCNKPGATGQCQGDGHGFENPAGHQPPGQNP